MQTEYVSIPMVAVHPGQINLYNYTEKYIEKPKPPVDRKNTEISLNDNPKQLRLFYNQTIPDYVHSDIPVNDKNQKQKRKFEHLLKSKRTANGNVSISAKRKMSKALNYLLFITNDKVIHNQFTGRNFKFKIAFVTLTLPSAQIHTDKEIKEKCLNQLLIELKKSYKVKHYIWRAEKQKNGNLHFHLIVNKFIPYQELRDKWNRIINKLGYVDRYRTEQLNWHKNGFRVRENLLKTWPRSKQLAAYERGAKLHWNSPNSTDIHSVQKIHNLKDYISKYLTKNEIKLKNLKLTEIQKNKIGLVATPKHIRNKRYRQLLSNRRNRQKLTRKLTQSGRIWSCSQSLSKLTGAQSVCDWQINEEIGEILKEKNVKRLVDTYYTVILFKPGMLQKFQTSKLYKLFSQYLLDKFDYSIQTEVFSN